MSTGTTVALLAPLISVIGGASVIGGIKWLRAVTAAVGKLTTVAETQAQTAVSLAAVQRQLIQIGQVCDDRWHRLGGLVPHPRWSHADDRPPADVGPVEQPA